MEKQILPDDIFEWALRVFSNKKNRYLNHGKGLDNIMTNLKEKYLLYDWQLEVLKSNLYSIY